MALALVPVHGLSDDEQHEGRHSGCPSSLAAVDSLSDHETETADGCQMVPVQPIQPPRPDPCQKKRKEQPSSVLQASMLRRKLFQVVSSACPCAQHGRFRHHAGSCCQQFRSELDTLVQLRLRLSRLEKHDADNEVLALLKEAGDQFRCAQKLLGRPVCQRAFRRLLGIGSMRYTRLKKAGSEGLAQAPLDGRKVSKKNTFKSNTAYLRKRAIMVEFLEEMRNSISEPLPEANQNPKLLDEQKRSLTLFRRHRGRRPRGASQWSRGGDRSSLRLLPPGSFTDYLRLLQSRWPDLKISLKLFTRESQHAKCTICIKHKLIIKRLATDRAARQSQCLLYSKHLDVQYSDRVHYWMSRAHSKLPMLPSGLKTITLIVDGLDHQKFRYPKDLAFSAKEFSSFLRPSLDCYAAIVHGHGVFVSLTEPFMKKDSSFCCDVVSHVLHTFASFCDLREYEVIIQSDNTSREIKNNCLLRWGGMLTGLSRCKRLEFRFLQSGHSHEDCDQWFAQIANLVESKRSLQTPSEFQSLLQPWLDEGQTRPDEQRFRKISSILLVAEIIYAALVALVRRTFLHLTVWLMFQVTLFKEWQHRSGISLGFSGLGAMWCSGAEPFCLDAAADHLQALAEGNLQRGQPLEADRILPSPGPAVGHGFDGGGVRPAVDLQPALNRMDMVHERMPRANLARYKSKTEKYHMFKAAAKLWSEGLPWPKAFEIVKEAFDSCATAT
ncbi:unnamed protein product [Cladocopium goreaui]|uniref:Modification methylase ScrFIA n=1 Tax=Cladocopium goreaui TaxID=2562237 RepID=A0A9P1FTD9_9DINO|nr:unnamed protein product [Cladocopium goreaui]